MATHRLLVATLVLTAAACSSSNSGGPSTTSSGGKSSATGGTTSMGGNTATGGSAATGGTTATGGAANTGGATVTGGTTVSQSGGASASGGNMGSGGAATGGSARSGGNPGSGGSAVDSGTSSGGAVADASTGSDSGTGSGGTKADGGGGNGSAPVPSKGCGKADGLKTITAGGSSVANGLPTSTKLKIKDREYILDVPTDYDPATPYRLVFSWHQAYGSANGNAVGQYPAGNGPNFDAKNYAYFGLRRESTNAKQPAIFVAPGGIGNFPWDYTRDVALFDSLLTLVGENLCVDESRVFTTGFSFGAMMSYALSVTRQSKLRAAVTMAAANYNLPGQPTPSTNGNVAYMGFTGMSDGTCPWVNSDSGKTGGKYCALQHAQVNGCTIPGSITTTTVGSKKWVCYEFQGCKAGYPVSACTFDGAHTPSSIDDGSSTGDDGLKAFIPPLAWKFMAQF